MTLKRSKYNDDLYLHAGNMDWLNDFAEESLKKMAEGPTVSPTSGTPPFTEGGLGAQQEGAKNDSDIAIDKLNKLKKQKEGKKPEVVTEKPNQEQNITTEDKDVVTEKKQILTNISETLKDIQKQVGTSAKWYNSIINRFKGDPSLTDMIQKLQNSGYPKINKILEAINPFFTSIATLTTLIDQTVGNASIFPPGAEPKKTSKAALTDSIKFAASGPNVKDIGRFYQMVGEIIGKVTSIAPTIKMLSTEGIEATPQLAQALAKIQEVYTSFLSSAEALAIASGNTEAAKDIKNEIAPTIGKDTDKEPDEAKPEAPMGTPAEVPAGAPMEIPGASAPGKSPRKTPAGGAPVGTRAPGAESAPGGTPGATVTTVVERTLSDLKLKINTNVIEYIKYWKDLNKSKLDDEKNKKIDKLQEDTLTGIEALMTKIETDLKNISSPTIPAKPVASKPAKKVKPATVAPLATPTK